MTSKHCSVYRVRNRVRRPLLPLFLLVLPAASLLPAQSSSSSFGGSGHITLEKPAPLRLKAGETAALPLRFHLLAGHHTNSNKPSDEYLIPLKLTWDATTLKPLEVTATEYPPGKLETYAFSDKPLSVYSGEFVVTTRLKAPADAPKGERKVIGKLRYQACNDTMCFPPRSLAVEATVAIQ